MTSQFDRRWAEMAWQQRKDLAESGGYIMLDHDITRKYVPLLVQKYGADGRDAFTIWIYLQAYTNGDRTDRLWMWAYPSRDQIITDLAIGKNRFNRLIMLLETEGMIRKAVERTQNGGMKYFYLPLFPEV